jgi:hypothetical protein
MPLLPQCPLPVQQKQMGHTLFWDSQEKWSDLIRLRHPPTKQMDHPPTVPNAKVFTNYANALKGLLTVLPSISTWDSGQFLSSNLCNTCAQSSYLGESTATSIFQWD